MVKVCMLTFCSGKCRDEFIDNPRPTLYNENDDICPYCGKVMKDEC